MTVPRILHLPKNPAGLATALAQGESSLGYDARVLTTRGDFTHGRADIELGLEDRRGVRYVVGHLNALRRLPEADTYHLWYGASLLHWPRFGTYLADLPWLTRNGRVVCTYVGSDARDMANRRADLRIGTERIERRSARWSNRWLDRGRRRSLELMANRADTIYVVNPDLALDIPATTRFVPYAVPIPPLSEAVPPPPRSGAVPGVEPPEAVPGVELPRSGAVPIPPEAVPGVEPPLSEAVPALPRRDGGGTGEAIRVVHAPSNPDLKGSVYIDAAMERLVDRYPGRVRYIRLDRVRRDEFHRELDQADIFVDQLLIGWYGVSAVEAMYRSVPTVCFLDQATLAPVPDEMRRSIPVVEARPDTIETVLESLLGDEAWRRQVASDGVAYARRWHDPVAVARWVHANGPDEIKAAAGQ